MIALACGGNPIDVLADLVLCIGVDANAENHIKSVAHNWMFSHGREWQWNISKPDNHAT